MCRGVDAGEGDAPCPHHSTASPLSGFPSLASFTGGVGGEHRPPLLATRSVSVRL